MLLLLPLNVLETKFADFVPFYFLVFILFLIYCVKFVFSFLWSLNVVPFSSFLLLLVSVAAGVSFYSSDLLHADVCSTKGDHVFETFRLFLLGMSF